jgi:hypothetical protein
MPMKFVVTGTSTLDSRMAAFSSRKHASMASDMKRR